MHARIVSELWPPQTKQIVLNERLFFQLAGFDASPILTPASGLTLYFRMYAFFVLLVVIIFSCRCFLLLLVFVCCRLILFNCSCSCLSFHVADLRLLWFPRLLSMSASCFAFPLFVIFPVVVYVSLVVLLLVDLFIALTLSRLVFIRAVALTRRFLFSCAVSLSRCST